MTRLQKLEHLAAVAELFIKRKVGFAALKKAMKELRETNNE